MISKGWSNNSTYRGVSPKELWGGSIRTTRRAVFHKSAHEYVRATHSEICQEVGLHHDMCLTSWGRNKHFSSKAPLETVQSRAYSEVISVKVASRCFRMTAWVSHSFGVFYFTTKIVSPWKFLLHHENSLCEFTPLSEAMCFRIPVARNCRRGKSHGTQVLLAGWPLWR